MLLLIQCVYLTSWTGMTELPACQTCKQISYSLWEFQEIKEVACRAQSTRSSTFVR